MWFIGVGVILLLMKWLEYGPVANWSWWIVLIPFGLGFLWFEAIEPLFGFDKKKAHNDLDKVKADRIKKQLERPKR